MPGYDRSAVPDESPDIERELQMLEAEMRRLEAEYNMFFAGRLPRPPWETRGRVDAMVKRLDRGHIANYGARFRFSTLQSRYTSFVDLWERGMRSREEGRRGPFSAPRPAPAADQPPAAERVLQVATLSDPTHEADKLRTLYESLSQARRDLGQPAVPYKDFATLVERQVAKLQQQGGGDVTFRLAMKDGKVSFTARTVKRK